MMVVLPILAAISVPFSSTILILTVIWILLWKPRNWKVLKEIPGPRPVPILGNGLELAVPNYKVISVIAKWCEKHGKRFLISIGSLDPRVILMDRNDVEKILSSNVNLNKSDDYTFMIPWLGTGLITSSRDQWFVRRKLLTPAFHFKILTNFLRIFNDQSMIMVKILKNCSTPQKTFDIFPYITRSALDIIVETAMGTQIHAQNQAEHGDSPYVKAICRMSELMFQRASRPWLKPDWIWNLLPCGRDARECLRIIHQLDQNVICERKLEFQREEKWNQEITGIENDLTIGKKPLAFLDILLQVQGSQDPTQVILTDQDIRDEVDTIMLAGHETTAANIGWTLFMLGTYPQTQVRVQAELDTIFEGQNSREITSDDLSKMKYLEACIKETLRLYPSVPLIARKTDTPVQLDNHLTLPSGTNVMIFPYLLHRDPEVFPDPEDFIPERFFHENTVGRHPYAYTPFSAGPRNCIGQRFAMMEIKTSVAQVLRNFNLKSMESREKIKVCMDIILRPLNGFPVQISPRI